MFPVLSEYPKTTTKKCRFEIIIFIFIYSYSYILHSPDDFLQEFELQITNLLTKMLSKPKI